MFHHYYKSFPIKSVSTDDWKSSMNIGTFGMFVLRYVIIRKNFYLHETQTVWALEFR